LAAAGGAFAVLELLLLLSPQATIAKAAAHAAAIAKTLLILTPPDRWLR
jgi:hypothetical protein